MAFTMSDLAAIERAIATGALKVKYKDREVQYSSLTDLFRAKAAIEKELGLGGRTGYVYPVHMKGVWR